MERITSFSLILFITLIFPLSILAQQEGPRGQYPDAIINPSWEFYSNNWLSTNLAGKGFTGVASLGDISVISLNPASLNVENKYNANVSYSYKPGIDYLPDIFTDAYLRNGHPSLSAGGGYRINENFQVGFAY